jgi:CheY-like chemotaxis protein
MQAARILVVDDDSNIRMSVRLCLETAGYIVEQAGQGIDALEFIDRATPDLILLDLAMPLMDGLTMLAEIRSLLGQPLPRVVVMTAHGSARRAIEAVRLGASDFLEKPFTPDELRQSVASALHAEVPPHLAPPGAGYGEVLHQVRIALRAGKFKEAEASLMTAAPIADGDPAFFNLAGVLQESYGRLDSACKFYQKATAANRAYQPAHRNLKRIGEIRRYGKSKKTVCFGDEAAASEESWKQIR